MLPECDKKMTKGVILAKACEYIAQLRNANEQLQVQNAQLQDEL